MHRTINIKIIPQTEQIIPPESHDPSKYPELWELVRGSLAETIRRKMDYKEPAIFHKNNVPFS